jgi:hypothetical protein
MSRLLVYAREPHKPLSRSTDGKGADDVKVYSCRRNSSLKSILSGEPEIGLRINLAAALTKSISKPGCCIPRERWDRIFWSCNHISIQPPDELECSDVAR